MDTHRGTFAGAHDLLDLLCQRQAELGLSNEALEEICEWPAGYRNKYLGPSREKSPGIAQVFLMMYALGLSGTLFVDAAKVRRVESAWRIQGQRRAAAVRAENPRVSKAMLKRAGPAVAAAMGRKGGVRRWEGTTRGDLDAHIARMNAARARKRLGAKRR